MLGVTRHNRSGVALRVANHERTVVDALDRPDLTGNWEEIWRSLESVEFHHADSHPLADCAVLPENLDQLKAVVAACCKFNAPITLRGRRTGNYGQCIPLYGGGVIDLTQFDRILSLEGGVARVEPGPRLDSQAPGHPV